jgi:hypothetical protein
MRLGEMKNKDRIAYFGVLKRIPVASRGGTFVEEPLLTLNVVGRRISLKQEIITTLFALSFVIGELNWPRSLHNQPIPLPFRPSGKYCINLAYGTGLCGKCGSC